METASDAELMMSLHWLKLVAGIDDQYIAKWDREAWRQWATAMNADPAGPNPCVPEWMHELMPGRWHMDFTGPFPSVAQLWPSMMPWFLEAETEGEDDFELVVEEFEGDSNPTFQQVRDVWMKAHETPGLLPLLHLALVPAKPYGEKVRGEISALYIVGDITSEQRKHFAKMIPSVKAKDFSYAAQNAEELLEHAAAMGRPGSGRLDLISWEWF